MIQYLKGLDNTPSGAKSARERYLEYNPGSVVITGYERSTDRHFLDISPATETVRRFPPRLRLVVNNG